MKTKEELLKELEYHDAKCLINDVEELYDYISKLEDLLPDWAKTALKDGRYGLRK